MRIEKKLMLALNKIADGFRYIESRPVLCGSEHAFRLPMGRCALDVQNRLDALVSAVGAPVELIDRGGAVIVRVVEKDFPQRMRFQMDDLRPDRLLIGYDRLFRPVYNRMMHLLSGGASGSGKTVWLRFVLYQMACMGAVVKIADLKGFSFFPFEALPGFQVVKNLPDTADLLNDACAELDRREQLVIRSRNRHVLKSLPYNVVVIDEAAQIAPKMHSGRMRDYARYCDECVARLAQKGREPKVILIYCTQRPDHTIINGQVKSNVEATVAFRTHTDYDSRIILNTPGAERISVATPGRCLFRGETLQTLQVPFIGESDHEWEQLLAPLKVEVLNDGSSHRTPASRSYIEGSYTGADRDDTPAGHTERFAGSKQKGVSAAKRAGGRQTNTVSLPWSTKDMAAETYSDEIAD
ncbi:hypothetical protein [Paenibacillus spongiae]|uniref:FtsK domain-containing protein n=1 Tax=Paenibacillus spongiae TaxID=2909671 RepID=A0ABY5SBD1_9BACL|nr:hypothetical protein [Paenibacillus spongiae]UVI31232.1 hypothetical protein L1F29_05145 [Paenibacillus spongiae]